VAIPMPQRAFDNCGQRFEPVELRGQQSVWRTNCTVCGRRVMVTATLDSWQHQLRYVRCTGCQIEARAPASTMAKAERNTAGLVPSKPVAGRPIEYVIAETAPLNEAQLAFRRAARGRLDFALPLDIWFDHRYGVAPMQRAEPVARRGRERWYNVMQVVKRAVHPGKMRRPPRFVQGGAVSPR
jgi:hypothetical protein